MYKLVIASLALLLLGFSTWQEDSIDKAEAKRLIKQLDHDSLAKRNDAEEKLVAMGPALLPLLDQAYDSDSAEFRTRIGRIRRHLQTRQVKQFAKATNVTIEGTFDLEDAFKEISKQSGNHYRGFEGRDIQLDLDLDDVPFLEALDQILDDAKLQLDPYRFESGYHSLRPRPLDQMDRSGAASYTGAFRVEPVRIDSVRDLRNPEVSGMRIQLEVGWESRLNPIAIRVPTDKMEMLDEYGDPIDVQFKGATVGTSVQPGAPIAELTLPAELPEHEVWKISKLIATMNVLLPGPVQTFKFDNLAQSKGKSNRIGDAVVTIERVEKNVDLYAVALKLEFDEAANSLESHRAWVFNNSMNLVNKEGKRIEPIGSETLAQKENSITVQYLFDSEIDPTVLALEYSSPIAIIDLPVKFELRNIELP